jgi:hypothetical protein
MAAMWRAEPERGRPWQFLKTGARIEHDDDDRQSNFARSKLLNRGELAITVVDKVVAVHVNSNFAIRHSS